MKKYINTLWMCMLLLFVGVSCSDDEVAPDPESVNPPKITLDSDNEFTVADKENQISLSFTVNSEWTISSNQSWCSPTTQKGGPGKITVSVDVAKNETYDSREAVVSILSGTAKKEVKVVQSQKDAIVLAKNKYEVEASQSKLTFEVQSNVQFEVNTDVDWIKLESDKSRGLTVYKLDVVVEENVGTEQREGHVIITKGDIRQIITIVQTESKLQELVIGHNLVNFVIPTLEGSIVDGQIIWGDNQEEAYQLDAQHTYDATGNYSVTIKVRRAEGMNVKTVEGITSIDLSKF